ncbi:MAG: hypothetical protein EBZ47_06080 [Chlamydiae bacterium]|nr:hypothetical protein [Chlamydiota bacterium]
MKFLLAQEHIDHFNKFGSIEFTNIFSEKECQSLLHSAEELLNKRINPTNRNPVHLFSNENLFLNTKNLWKDGLPIKKLCIKKQLAELAHHLFRKKPIRLAYDHYIRTGTLQDCPFKEDSTIQEISSIRPTLGALFILLEPLPSSIENPAIPKQVGSMVFVANNVILPLVNLFSEKNLSMLMIAFTAGKPLYCLETKDPHTHSFKREGLVFGDTVGEDLCPTLYAC